MNAAPKKVRFDLPGGFRVGSASEFTPEQRSQLLQILEMRASKGMQPLNGRGNVVHGEIAGLGKLVVKRYLRGGLLRRVIRKKYVRRGPTRGEIEYNLLSAARSLGVNAPEPVAFVYRGWPLYDAWLVTREIENRGSFAELGAAHEEEIYRHAEEIVRQIGILIRAKIFHVDLHPGNVIIDAAGGVYILDFDKAHAYRGAKNRLRDHYLVRWRRAVIKHKLPDVLAERICPGLRRNFEES